MRHRLRRPTVYETLALALAGLALAGLSYAAIPAADGTIKGCYAKKSGLLPGVPYSKGDLRVVDEGASCRAYEDQLTWNQKGLPGDPGEPGSAAAYARVEFDGSVDPGRSKNVGDQNIVVADEGVYCLRDLPFTPRSAVVTTSTVSTGARIASVSVAPPGGTTACSGEIAQIAVRTFFVAPNVGPNPSEAGFTIWIED